MLDGKGTHLGYEKNSVAGNNSGNSRNGSNSKRIQTEHGESAISIPRDRNGLFEPIACPNMKAMHFLYRKASYLPIWPKE